jgi:hypothetical protein
VEDDSHLLGLVELQLVPRQISNKSSMASGPQLLALQMISCHQMALLFTAGEQESTGCTVVRPTSQELQGEERIG